MLNLKYTYKIRKGKEDEESTKTSGYMFVKERFTEHRSSCPYRWCPKILV